MRTKPGVDTLSFDDLYNNLRVFESDVRGSIASSYSTQNVTFVSFESTSMYPFFANQSSGPQLDHEDLEQLDEFDLEEMDLKWQVAMISMRLKKFYKKTGRKLQFDAQWSTGYKAKDNKRRPKKQEEPKALVTLDGDGVDWTGYAEDEQENFALMAYNNSRSDTDVTSCSKECVEAYAKLKKIYDEQREQLGDASIEIKAYTLALAKKLLAEAVKEKEELKINLKNFQSSSKGLSKLLKSQMSAKDKSGLGLQMLKGMHAVPSPMTGNNMPQKSDFGIDELNFTYGQKQSKTSESTANTSDFDSCKSNSRSMSQVDPQKALKNKGIVDSGCSRHMTRNNAYLVEYQDYNGGPVAFGGSKGQITGKGKIITGKLDFEDVYFVTENKNTTKAI
ncbi:hypothetical protein Tco_0677421 [Tanacetum coccineum]|uniref:Retrovirus-related Pol polyprotein from transposon TNT 1-94-like beta-barrel domain-containing protein n=1 Tax=Tanacetum coccineum TaxID=301880 RepID=A0ABQ4XCR8_9ASTR